MKDKIKSAYRQSGEIYDDVLTQEKWWSKLYIDLFWSGVRDNDIAEAVLEYIPDGFSGRLLDVPVGTGVFTTEKYARMTKADITCLDYSEDMLVQAKERFEKRSIENVNVIQGDVGALPFEDDSFDMVLSMNGFHAFPDKAAALSETCRVLKSGGKFIACFYISGRSELTDGLVNNALAKKGWFTPPFDTLESLKARLAPLYNIKSMHTRGAMVYFCAVKK